MATSCPGNGGKQIDTSVEGAQNFFANLSVSLFHNREEAVRLLDGVMVDGTSWTGPGRYGPNVSAARYETLFAGKMKMLAKMQGIMSALNGGEVWGNPLLEYGVIGAPGHQGDDPGARWNTTMACASPDPLGSPCRDALTRRALRSILLAQTMTARLMRCSAPSARWMPTAAGTSTR